MVFPPPPAPQPGGFDTGAMQSVFPRSPHFPWEQLSVVGAMSSPVVQQTCLSPPLAETFPRGPLCVFPLRANSLVQSGVQVGSGYKADFDRPASSFFITKHWAPSLLGAHGPPEPPVCWGSLIRVVVTVIQC